MTSDDKTIDGALKQLAAYIAALNPLLCKTQGGFAL
jgi:hypothetical protein